MNQVPIVPAVNQCAMVQRPQYFTAPQVQPQQPNYNAVKIDIHNPSVGVPQAQPQYQDPIYTYPQAPVYNYPQAPVYNYPQAQAPVYVPQAPVCEPVPQQAPTQEVQPPVSQIPVPQPTVIEQQNVNVPAQPVEEPKAADEKTETAVQKPEVVEPQAVEPQVDLNAFIAKLANPDFEVQANAMEEIANIIKENPAKATDLVDAKVFDSLNNIVNLDTSALEGPSAEQTAAREKIIAGKEVTEDEKALANTIAPKEQAERNKSYALYTIAMMDKLYGDEVAKLSNNKVPLTELPGVTTLVDNLKDNANPMVRASAIEALSYIQTPEYKQDLNTLFTVAQNDQDAGVAQAAKTALEKLEQV